MKKFFLHFFIGTLFISAAVVAENLPVPDRKNDPKATINWSDETLPTPDAKSTASPAPSPSPTSTKTKSKRVAPEKVSPKKHNIPKPQ